MAHIQAKIAKERNAVWKWKPLTALRHLVLILLVAFSLFPIYFTVINSVKGNLQFTKDPLALPELNDINLGNYAIAWDQMAQPVVNSLIIVVISVLGILLLASLSAYAFAQLDFPAKKFLFGLIFILLLIPSFLTFIPLYLQIKATGLSNGYAGLILPYIAGGQAFSIFVLRTAFSNISSELMDAARIDGANNFRIYLQIAIPLARPVIASVAIINLVPLWNDYLLPQLLLDRTHRTVTMALVTFQGNAQTHTAPNFGGLMSAYVLASLPLLIIFLFLMKSYVEGLTNGSLKI